MAPCLLRVAQQDNILLIAIGGKWGAQGDALPLVSEVILSILCVVSALVLGRGCVQSAACLHGIGYRY